MGAALFKTMAKGSLPDEMAAQSGARVSKLHDLGDYRLERSTCLDPIV